MQIAVKNLQAEEVGSIELNDAIFAIEPRADILQRMVVYQLAKRRAGTHKTKSRGEVSYSTKKLFKQKGTGRARHGDRGVNIFRKGGTVHGPTPRDHSTALPKKVRALAMKMALSSKVASGKLIVLESTEIADHKTKAMAASMNALGVVNGLIIDGATVNEKFALATRNLPTVDVLPTQGLNVYDILRRDTLILTREAIAGLTTRFGNGATDETDATDDDVVSVVSGTDDQLSGGASAEGDAA